MDKVPPSGLAHMGNMRRLGLTPGKPFAPDERAKASLKRAAKTAGAMVLSMAFRNRLGVEVYDNRQYGTIFYAKSPVFFLDEFEEVEERAGAWHHLIGNVASAIPAKPGTGGFYLSTFTDKNGDPLIGSNTYRLRVPARVPVKQFAQGDIHETEMPFPCCG